MELSQLGWNQFFEDNFEPHKQKDLVPGRVARHDRSTWLVYCERGEVIAEVSGRFRRGVQSSGDWPTVGDWVVIATGLEKQRAIIHSILPRRSAFSRKAADSGGMPDSGGRTDEQVLAANVDTAFIMSALDNDFSLRRLERYLATAYEGGVRPVIILNKIDLCDNVEAFVNEVESIAMGVEVLPVCATEGYGLDQLKQHIETGRTIVLLGSSGVGKSTLINSVLGSDTLKTGPVREYDGRGRHTTTWRELILIPSGGVLIDTPGLRELQTWVDENSLKQTFEDIEALAEKCRFRNCRHRGEPGCAVETAIASGTLNRERLTSYDKLLKELRRVEARRTGKQRHLDRVEGKKFASIVKEQYRLKLRPRKD
jgi:ribosome biogenesis GTPase